jgi:hypothetical protein
MNYPVTEAAFNEDTQDDSHLVDTGYSLNPHGRYTRAEKKSLLGFIAGKGKQEKRGTERAAALKEVRAHQHDPHLKHEEKKKNSSHYSNAPVHRDMSVLTPNEEFSRKQAEEEVQRRPWWGGRGTVGGAPTVTDDQRNIARDDIDKVESLGAAMSR